MGDRNRKINGEDPPRSPSLTCRGPRPGGGPGEAGRDERWPIGPLARPGRMQDRPSPCRHEEEHVLRSPAEWQAPLPRRSHLLCCGIGWVDLHRERAKVEI